jgi:hypothetical protein
MAAAFVALRRHARQRNIELTDLALAVVRGDTRPQHPRRRPALRLTGIASWARGRLPGNEAPG